MNRLTSAMSVALGTMEAFDRARATRDAREARRLLRAAHVDELSIERIIKEP
jgi:hypothetical protein